jgi:hypothetical protein
MKTFAVVSLVLLLAPLTYSYYFLIVEFPKKYGYAIFTLALLSYLGTIVIGTILLKYGTVGLITLFALPLILQVIGVYVLRDKFIEGLRDIGEKLRKQA